MRWPRRRHRPDAAAAAAKESAQRALREERHRLVQAEALARALAVHRERNNFAEQMRIAFGGER